MDVKDKNTARQTGFSLPKIDMSNDAMIKLFSYLFLAGLAALIIYLRYRFITLPLERDEGTYAYIAWRMDFHEMPYRDIFDHKPPVIYFIYRLAFLLFGENYTAIRGFTMIYVVLIMLAMFFIVKKNSGLKEAFISSALYSFYQSSVIFQGINSNTEVFASLFLLVSFYFAIGLKQPSFFRAFLSGLFFSIAFFTKETVFPVGAAMLLWWGFKKMDKKIFLAYITGFLVFSGVVFLWLWTTGILKDFIIYGIKFNLAYFKSEFPSLIAILLLFVGENFLLVAGYLVIGVFVIKNKFANEPASIIFIYITSLIIGIASLRGGFPHYYLMLYPFMCMAAAWVLSYILTRSSKMLRIPVIVLAAAVFLWSFGLNNIGYYFLTMNEISFCQYGYTAFAESSIISDNINMIKKPGDNLFVWPCYPQIYFLTKMKSPTKQINVLPSYRHFDMKGVNKAFDEGKKSNPVFFVINPDFKRETGNFLNNYKPLMKGKVLELYYRIK